MKLLLYMSRNCVSMRLTNVFVHFIVICLHVECILTLFGELSLETVNYVKKCFFKLSVALGSGLLKVPWASLAPKDAFRCV